MINNDLIALKVENIIDSLRVHEPGLVVLSGFDPKLVGQLSNKYSPLVDLSSVIDGEKYLYSIENIEKNRKKIISNLLIIDELRIVPAEIIQYISSRLNLEQVDVPVYIISNNIFDYTPCFINSNSPSLEEQIEDEHKKIQEDILSNYYIHSTNVENDIFVQQNVATYFEDSLLSKINIFKENLPLQNIEKKSKTGEVYDSNIVSGDYFKLIKHFFSDELPKEITLRYNNDTEKDHFELESLAGALKALGYNVCLLDEPVRRGIRIREELFQYRNQFWSKGDTFRNIEFYKDPSVSKETIRISQGEVVENIVSNVEKSLFGEKSEDVFITAPTGAGKSLLFQLAGVYLGEYHNLVTLVVSPLKALMKDQVENLQEQGYNKVAYINSDISIIQRDEILNRVKQSEIDILYLAPELLLSYALDFFIGDRKLGMLVIDEAHLVTTWGRDFRVDYWFLGNYIRKIRRNKDHKCIVVSVTATAVYGGSDDLVYETISSLNMLMPTLYIGSVKREDITFDIRKFNVTDSYETQRMQKTKDKIDHLLNNNTKAIIYFPWVRQIDEIFGKFRGVTDRVASFHSRLSREHRIDTARRFREGEITIILASKAFGMGIDIPDIEYVYHHAPSGNLSDYVQEVGRAARLDSIQGVAGLDFTSSDLKYTRTLWGLSSIKQWQVKQCLQKLGSLYEHNGKRNFLVNIDDFSYLFPESDEGMQENKVKSTLMLIEKDFIRKHRFPVVLVRPKSLFTMAYVRVLKESIDEFQSTYGSYILPLKGQEIDRKPSSYNKVYKVRLDKIWEDMFPEEGFPQIKRKYFRKELFGELSESVYPQLRLVLKLHNTVSFTASKLNEYFEQIEEVLGSLHGKYFTKDEFMNALINKGIGRNISESIIDVFLNFYISKYNKDRGGRRSKSTIGAFIQPKRNGDSMTYRIIDYGFGKVKAIIRKKFMERFDKESLVYAYFTADMNKNMDKVLLAYVLEALNLAVYELHGGERPQMFIRINDPNKILFGTDNYRNSIVDEIAEKHYKSMDLMERFFLDERESSERWDFIEDYFLGNLDYEQLGA